MAKRNDVSVKMDAEVVAEAKMVAASRDLSLAEYLSDLARPLVRRDLEQEFARRSLSSRPAETRPPPEPGPKPKGKGRGHK
jgi:hypothetical protein